MTGWRKRTIMEMARKAGINHPEMIPNTLEAFAALVREEATAEANARANASWTLMCEKMVAIEREACAEICKKHADVYAGLEQNSTTKSAWAACMDNRDAIRARGQA